MAQQYIYQMQGLTKAFPGGKKVFENIWLSFYSDAKIGVVGVNGSGKSTLLKIIAGLDTEFNGEAKAADGVKMGYSGAGAASRRGASTSGPTSSRGAKRRRSSIATTRSRPSWARTTPTS